MKDSAFFKQFRVYNEAQAEVKEAFMCEASQTDECSRSKSYQAS